MRCGEDLSPRRHAWNHLSRRLMMPRCRWDNPMDLIHGSDTFQDRWLHTPMQWGSTSTYRLRTSQIQLSHRRIGQGGLHLQCSQCGSSTFSLLPRNICCNLTAMLDRPLPPAEPLLVMLAGRRLAEPLLVKLPAPKRP